jgi:hypothetical protein
MTNRPTADTITDDQLDELHARLAAAERALAAVRRLAALTSQLDPHSRSDYLMGAKDALDRATRTIDRTTRKAQR